MPGSQQSLQATVAAQGATLVRIDRDVTALTESLKTIGTRIAESNDRMEQEIAKLRAELEKLKAGGANASVQQ